MDRSFGGLCLRLQSLMDSVLELGSESLIPEKETLVQLLFGAINIVYSVRYITMYIMPHIFSINFLFVSLDLSTFL